MSTTSTTLCSSSTIGVLRHLSNAVQGWAIPQIRRSPTSISEALAYRARPGSWVLPMPSRPATEPRPQGLRCAYKQRRTWAWLCGNAEGNSA